MVAIATIAAEARRAAVSGASPEERAKLGKEARAAVPRSSHGDWEHVKRLAASLEIAARDRGFSDADESTESSG